MKAALPGRSSLGFPKMTVPLSGGSCTTGFKGFGFQCMEVKSFICATLNVWKLWYQQAKSQHFVADGCASWSNVSQDEGPPRDGIPSKQPKV